MLVYLGLCHWQLLRSRLPTLNNLPKPDSYPDNLSFKDCQKFMYNSISLQTKSTSEMISENIAEIDKTRSRYPFCIVWTPIPCLTWFLPFIGHMGIATSTGIIRDFAGPYCVTEDDMAFGRPTKYWQLKPSYALGGASGWDRGVLEASDVYKGRMHNLCCDNCHSHVAMALNMMHYKKSTSWNMVILAFLMLIHGRYVNVAAFFKTWVPFFIICGITITLVVSFQTK